jgi:hypothetical protein
MLVGGVLRDELTGEGGGEDGLAEAAAGVEIKGDLPIRIGCHIELTRHLLHNLD